MQKLPHQPKTTNGPGAGNVATRSRKWSALFLGSVFLALVWAFGAAMAYGGVIGARRFAGLAADLLAEAMIVGSPFAWILPLPQQLGFGSGPINGYVLNAYVFAPYPVSGCVMGYFWPIRSLTMGGAVKAALLRFCLVLMVFEAIGLVFVLRQF